MRDNPDVEEVLNEGQYPETLPPYKEEILPYEKSKSNPYSEHIQGSSEDLPTSESDG